MTNRIEDFIEHLEHYETLVEVANGGIVHVTHRGKVKIHMSDTINPNHSIVVQLNDVLYVPDLTRRLISVQEWNSCGGHIMFLQDRTNIDNLALDSKVYTDEAS
jgi:hypothetical protein